MNTNTLHRLTSGTVMAFDFGTARIGVAVGEYMLRVAHPLTTLNVRTETERYIAIGALIAEWQPQHLIVGLPLYADGKRHDMTLRCERFARQLEGRYSLPVSMVDERYTSVDAEASLSKMGRGGQKNKHLVDQAAAQIILQNHFDATGMSSP